MLVERSRKKTMLWILVGLAFGLASAAIAAQRSIRPSLWAQRAS